MHLLDHHAFPRCPVLLDTIITILDALCLPWCPTLLGTATAVMDTHCRNHPPWLVALACVYKLQFCTDCSDPVVNLQYLCVTP